MKGNANKGAISLPILLSFNELGWIAVFAMALFWLSLLGEHRQVVRRSASDQASHTNELARLAYLLVGQSNELAQSRGRVKELENLPHGNRLLEMEKDIARRTAELRAADQRRQELERQLAAAAAAQAELRLTVSNLNAEKVELELRWRSSETNLAELKSRNEHLTATNSKLESQLREREGSGAPEAQIAMLESQNERLRKGIPQELLSLKGPMNRVLFLLDRSASMGDGNRWGSSLGVIEVWLKLLPIQQCAVIAFGDDCTQFPAPGEMIDASSGRESLLEQVRRLRPSGNTATLRAMEMAYTNEADTIILFTDGEPFLPGAGLARTSAGAGRSEESTSKPERQRISREQMSRILALARKHPEIPVNVVAVANYFQREQSDFLLELARATGGTFLGR